jgi:disulfide bond formation protein DsbB
VNTQPETTPNHQAIMRIPSSRAIWLLIAVTVLGLVVTSVVMTEVLHLHPCHLCILQRILFIALGTFALLAAFMLPRLFGGLALLAAAGGVGVAGYQVWLQAQPMDPFSCASVTPEPVEHVVDWLGNRMPELFLATGLCQEVELTILKLSLAGWAIIAFSAAFVAGMVALSAGSRRRWR